MSNLISSTPVFCLEACPASHHNSIFFLANGLDDEMTNSNVRCRSRRGIDSFTCSIHCFPDIRIYITITVSTAGIANEICDLKPAIICIALHYILEFPLRSLEPPFSLCPL